MSSRKITPSKPASKSSLAKKSQTPGKGSMTSRQSATKVQKPATSTTEKEHKFELPALSITSKRILTETEFDKLRKKTIRRNAPPGEDLKHIKEILLNLKRQKTPITVQEFISLLAPSTGDKGVVLRQVMQDHLNSFRKLSKKVYDTIIEDVSDVLLNQQLQLAEFYKERKQILHERMMRKIEEIFQMAPTFDFERYAKEGDSYLRELFPLPAEIQVEPEELELMKRQAAYHRLAWLRSEGERLNEENNSLKQRLLQLKGVHQDERRKMMEMEQEAEAKREALEATQAEKAEALEELTESLERHIIDEEKKMRRSKDQGVLMAVGKGQVKKTKSKGKVKKKSAWGEQAARQLEETALERRKTTEATSVVEGNLSNREQPRSFSYGRSPSPSPQLRRNVSATPSPCYSPDGTVRCPVMKSQLASMGGYSQMGPSDDTDADDTWSKLY